MARPYLIIDGYNLMHAVGLARPRYGPGDMELCRNRLLKQLAAELSPPAIARTTVVFDAFTAEDDSNRHQTVHGLTIIFAPRGTDADSEIERLIVAHPAPRQLMIVSGDHRLHKAARKRRSQAMDSDVFWNGLADEAESPATRRRSCVKPGIVFVPPEFLSVDLPNDDIESVFDDDYLSDLADEFDETD